MSAFDVHPVLLLSLGLCALPLLADETRYPTLRWQGWLLPLMGLLLSATAWLLLRLPALAAAGPGRLGLWAWLTAWLLLPLVVVLFMRRWMPAPKAGPDAWLAALPLPVFWIRPELWPAETLHTLPPALLPLMLGLLCWLLLALLIGAGEKCRLNRQPEALQGLPFRLLLLAALLMLAKGAEALLAGRLP